jgi:hypothetical protein
MCCRCCCCCWSCSFCCCCQDVGQAEACGAAGSTEHKQLCKQLAAALCSLAEMRMALAEDVPEVSRVGWGCWSWWLLLGHLIHQHTCKLQAEGGDTVSLLCVGYSAAEVVDLHAQHSATHRVKAT